MIKQIKGFELLNTYFDKIYVISIERNFESRLAKLNENLEGLNFNVFKGVDGNLLSEVEIENNYDDSNARKLFTEYCKYSFDKDINRGFKLGEIGCALSHINVYRDIIKNKYEKTLILEDDAKLMFNLEKTVSNVISSIPQEWDLIYWGYRWYDSESRLSKLKRLIIYTPLIYLLNLIGVKKYKNNNQKYPKKFNKYFSKSGYHCGSHAYSITLKTADILLKQNFPVKYCADQLFSSLIRTNSIIAFVNVPMLIREDQNFESSIV
jgi:glycosyl transferase family 25